MFNILYVKKIKLKKCELDQDLVGSLVQILLTQFQFMTLSLNKIFDHDEESSIDRWMDI